MKSFYGLENTIRDYAWGDLHAIPDFLGIDYPEGHPAAELWMGAHPGAPSRLVVDGTSIGLDEFIRKFPQEALGGELYGEYGRLPFLFKLLAAGKSLSIQAHPDKQTAEAGFARENTDGIPPDSPIRNYRDDNHKPEIIMALTSFSAMIGFRRPEVVASLFRPLSAIGSVGIPSENVLRRLESGDDAALEDFLGELLNAGESAVQGLLAAAGRGGTEWDSLQEKWVPSLLSQFPGDIGALAPLFLNVVELKAGQALYQPAAALHAYLSGFGLELMANSDNVLRGGLTPKNIDVPELLSILEYHPVVPEILAAVDDGNGLAVFDTPASEFALAIGEYSSGSSVELPAEPSPMILIVLQGSLTLTNGSDSLVLEKGQSAFFPAGRGAVRIEGEGRVALAGVGG